jgi:hypothetical protein
MSSQDPAPDGGQEPTSPEAVVRLRAVLRQRARAIAEDAARAGGHVPAEAVEELARLARVAEVCTAVEPPRPRPRWPAAAALGLTLLVATLLLFVRVPQTAITLDVTLSSVSFEVPAMQVLLEAVTLTTLGASGFREIRLPASGGRAPETFGVADGDDPAIQIAVASDSGRTGTISLGPITTPPGTRVWVRYLGRPNQYRLSLQGPELQLQAVVLGPVLASPAGRRPERLDFDSPKAVQLRPGTDVVDLDLSFPERPKDALAHRIQAHDISFSRVDQYADPERALVRRLPTIESGSLYYEALDGRERRLRAGQEMRLGESRGEVRAMRLVDGGIALRFEGRVGSMSTGPDASPTDLMPTWLEWLRARHGLALLWGTALYLFGLVGTTMRWLRVPL